MQQTFNLDWLAHNESVKYPIDSKASFVPDMYTAVPSGLMGVVTDVALTVPASISVPYLSALTITDDLITLIISSETQALFAFSSRRSSLNVGKYYDLTSFQDGCFGVIVFGSGAKTHRGEYRFLSASESGFLPSVCHRYASLAVSSIARTGNATSAQGDIKIKGSSEIALSVEQIAPRTKRSTVPAQSVKAIVIGLNTTEAQNSTGENIMARYCGPCDGRPESSTCTRTSVERLGAVLPDCSGNVTIHVDGLNLDSSTGQFLISSGYSLDDVCVKDKITALIGENQCPYTEQTTSNASLNYINFNTSVYPENGSGLSISSAGITSAVDGEETTVHLPDLSSYSELAVAFTSSGTFTLTIGTTWLKCNGPLITTSRFGNTTISSTATELRLLVNASTGVWELRDASTSLGAWVMTISSLSNMTMTLKNAYCRKIEYR